MAVRMISISSHERALLILSSFAEVTDCIDGKCICTEPYYGERCRDSLTRTHAVGFALVMYPSMVIYFCLFVLGAVNLYRHNSRRPGTPIQLAPVMTALMVLCNFCSALM